MAVNADRKNGLIPVGSIVGGSWSDAIETFILDGSHSAMYIGDVVKMTSDGYLDIFAAGDSAVTAIGVVVGVEVNRGLNVVTEFPGYMPANVAGKVFVVTDPNVLFEVQEDGVGGSLALADVGQNIEIINGTGSTSTGLSGIEIDSSTKATTATLPFRLLKLVNRPDNELGSTATPKARWIVKFNEHFYKQVTGV